MLRIVTRYSKNCAALAGSVVTYYWIFYYMKWCLILCVKKPTFYRAVLGCVDIVEINLRSFDRKVDRTAFNFRLVTCESRRSKMGLTFCCSIEDRAVRCLVICSLVTGKKWIGFSVIAVVTYNEAEIIVCNIERICQNMHFKRVIRYVDEVSSVTVLNCTIFEFYVRVILRGVLVWAISLSIYMNTTTVWCAYVSIKVHRRKCKRPDKVFCIYCPVPSTGIYTRKSCAAYIALIDITTLFKSVLSNVYRSKGQSRSRATKWRVWYKPFYKCILVLVLLYGLYVRSKIASIVFECSIGTRELSNQHFIFCSV